MKKSLPSTYGDWNKMVSATTYMIYPGRNAVITSSARSLWFCAVALLLVLLQAAPASAQQPVQVTTVLRAPYSLQLSDYYASTQEKLVVVLTNRDLNKPVLNVRLRMSIESQTVSLRSREFSTSPTLQLEAGVPMRLSLGDLAPYFNPENLDFSGMTRAQYQMSAKLPEGFYQFCFEAIEVSTGQVASAKNCSMAWISLSDPPLLNIPQKGESIALRDPQNIIFQWTPRHLNSPNSAYATEYDFQLVELWDNSLVPEVAFQSMQPLYQATVRTTTMLYGPSQPLLIAGKRYGWRVRARARSGVEEVDVFRNQGFSEIYWFTYQDMCPAPKGVRDSTGLFGSIKLSWLPDAKHTAYMVTYREKGKDDAVWFDQQAPGISTIISDVKAGMEYEYRVAAFCNTDQPVYSDIHTAKAPSQDEKTFANCSIVPDAQLKNKEELKTLKVGDEFKANDFPVKITEISGSSPYTGKGYVKIPFLGDFKVGATFENVKVNTDKQLMEGVVITTYNAKEGNVIDIDNTLDALKDYPGIVSRLQNTNADSQLDALTKITDKVVANAEKELPKEEAEQVKKNTKELIEAKKNYDKAKTAYDALPDNDPKKKELQKDVEKAKDTFNEIKSRFDGADKNAVSTEPFFIKYDKLANPATQYAFDAFKYSGTEKNYETTTQGKYAYTLPWKAVPLGGYDWVSASPINPSDVMPDSVVFRSSTGTLQSQKLMTNETQVRVHGYATGETSLITAYLKKKIGGKDVNVELGKLNVVSYPRKYRKLIIVPVNGKTAPCSKEDIQRELNKVYNPAMVEWSVEMKPSFTCHYDLDNNGVRDNFKEVNNLYTSEMKIVIKEYAAKVSFEPNVHYLFLVDRAQSGDWLGYNPFQKQAGFLFMNAKMANPIMFNWTLAHEIGHGAYRFIHTFEEYGIPEGNTENLMDYSVKPGLDKYQWDLIHNPPIMLQLLGDNYESFPE